MRTVSLILFAVSLTALVTVFRLVLCALGCLVYIYLLPGIIAEKRGHPRRRDIYLVCALSGWLVLPWLGALWAAMRAERKAVAYIETPLTMQTAEE